MGSCQVFPHSITPHRFHFSAELAVVPANETDYGTELWPVVAGPDDDNDDDDDDDETDDDDDDDDETDDDETDDVKEVRPAVAPE
jgi:hypothetical protein